MDQPPQDFLPRGESDADLDVDRLLDRLRRAAPRLASLSIDRRLKAWRRAVGRLLDPDSSVRRKLDAVLAASVRLSPPGLQAGLAAIASGMLGASAEDLFHDAAGRDREPGRPPALVVLASNLPGLALQTVLPALALARPLIVRSSRQEPHFAPTLFHELARAEPELSGGFAALTWTHGDEIETELLSRCDPVLAYGTRASIEALRARVTGRLVEYGPKLSIGVVAADAGEEDVVRMARDVALFDQRGCLSVQLVLSLAPSEPVAASLVRGLERQARELPPGAAILEESAAVRRELDLARMQGDEVIATSAGQVIVEPFAARPLRTSPGRRVVRLRPVHSSGELHALLAPLSGALQGAALAGSPADGVHDLLAGLGVSRITASGRLQETDARWQNGGIDPLDAL